MPPSIIPSNITPQIQFSSFDYNLSLYDNNEVLLINPHNVLWYRNSSLVRKFQYDEDSIVNAHIVNFKSGQAVVVMLKNRAYIYCQEKETVIENFSFSVDNSMEFEHGLVLERSVPSSQQQQLTDLFDFDKNEHAFSSSKACFLTVIEPLTELGMIVSSSTTSFSSSESLTFFPKTPGISIAATFNSSTNSISLYFVRFLTRNKNHRPRTSSLKRKSRNESRKSSLNNPEDDSGSIPANELELPSGKRSVSHSELLMDRMALNSNPDVSEFNDSFVSTANASESFRKDAVFTKIESIPFTSSKTDLKLLVVDRNNEQAVIVLDKDKKVAQALIYKSSNNAVSLPQLKNSVNFECADIISLSSTSHPGYILMLDNSCSHLQITNLFTQSFSCKMDFPVDSITSLVASEGPYFVAVSHNIYKIFHLHFEPIDPLAGKCLSAFKHMFGADIHENIWMRWCVAVCVDDMNDWQAFVAALLSILVPEAQPKTVNSNTETLKYANMLNETAAAVEDPNFAVNTIFGLHLIREELKLNVVDIHSKRKLDSLLTQLALWMGLPQQYVDFYLDNQSLDSFDKTVLSKVDISPEQPLCLMKSLCSLFTDDLVPYVSFSQLCEANEALDEEFTPRTYHILRVFEVLVSPKFTAQNVVNLMYEYDMDSFILDTYPIGISLPLKEFLALCKNTVSLDSSLGLINLLERKDLAKLFEERSRKQQRHVTSSNAVKDTHQIIQSIKNDDGSSNVWDGVSETAELGITKLLFAEDRRYYEITRLLQTSRIQTVTLSAPPETDEIELLNLQKELSALAAQRTLSVPLGRGALFLGTKFPILTEKFPMPKLNFDTLILPSGMTLSLDKEFVSSDLIDWGYFHNGASAGLTIFKNIKDIVGSWIVFHKPSTFNSQHGGFLLSLGLCGHLKDLEEWHIYNYLGPKHTHTSVGLLLGMSASAKGSMDMKLTKVLSVHVVALLPQGATDLNVSLPVQTAGLVGIGLLYLETQHRRMSEILLSQIGNKISHNDQLIADESYRLAAGIALGYTNLGKGSELDGLNDTHMTNRLLSLATSLKDVQEDVVYDKSAAGATVALGFIYMKSENEGVASKLAVPETEKLLDYIRPDILLLRTVAKNLILWDQIEGTDRWVRDQVPKWLLAKYDIALITSLDSDQLAYFNCIGGACLSIALKYASSGNLQVNSVILGYLDQCMRLTAMTVKMFDENITQSALLVIQDAIALSCAIIMAGTGDLDTFRRLRVLHNRTNNNILYSNYAAASMALGILFMGSGKFAFDDSNFSIAAILTAVYPAPAGGTECEIYLQALRHFWVMGAQPRCLILRDYDTNKPVSMPIEIELESGAVIKKTAPCLIPQFMSIVSVRTLSPDIFELFISFDDLRMLPDLYDRLKKRLTLYVYPKKLQTLMNDTWQNSEKDELDQTFDALFESHFNINEHNVGDSAVNNVRLEVMNMVTKPQGLDDLWNAKLLFLFYDKVSFDPYYLSEQFIEKLRISLAV